MFKVQLDLLWASSLGLSLAFISSSNSADMGMEIYKKKKKKKKKVTALLLLFCFILLDILIWPFTVNKW